MMMKDYFRRNLPDLSKPRILPKRCLAVFGLARDFEVNEKVSAAAGAKKTRGAEDDSILVGLTQATISSGLLQCWSTFFVGTNEHTRIVGAIPTLLILINL